MRGWRLLFLLILCSTASTTVPTGVAASEAVSTLFTTRQAFREEVLTGFTRPRTVLDLLSEESGRCVRVFADVGEVIGAKGVYAELDGTFLRLELEQVQAQRRQSTSEATYYGKELARFSSLLADETVAESSVDELRFRYEAAIAQEAALAAQAATLEERLRRMVIRAPAGWVVMERNVEPGKWVAAGSLVGVVGQFTTLLVPYALTVEELSALSSIEELTLYMPDFATQARARVRFVSPDFDPVTRKISVECEITKGDFPFRGGLRAQLRLQLPEPGNVVLVPRESLLLSYEEYFLVRQDGSRVKVTLLGGDDEGMVRVSAPGLEPDMEFLLSPGS